MLRSRTGVSFRPPQQPRLRRGPLALARRRRRAAAGAIVAVPHRAARRGAGVRWRVDARASIVRPDENVFDSPRDGLCSLFPSLRFAAHRRTAASRDGDARRSRASRGGLRAAATPPRTRPRVVRRSRARPRRRDDHDVGGVAVAVAVAVAVVAAVVVVVVPFPSRGAASSRMGRRGGTGSRIRSWRWPRRSRKARGWRCSRGSRLAQS